MIDRCKWTERKFSFDIPPGWMPNVIERLRGAMPRMKELGSAISDARASAKINNTWSIKENIGHLSDLEALHLGRINDFIDRKPILRAADMSNQMTEQANHNSKSVHHLIREFMVNRENLLRRLEQLDDASQQFVSTHPRLNMAMRPVDMAFFIAEHDDHHMATIAGIMNVQHNT